MNPIDHPENDPQYEGLKVQAGIETPVAINTKAVIKPKKRIDVATCVEGIKHGDINLLGRAITLVESTRADDAVIARQIIQEALPFSGGAIRVGITGTPGAGKSTFIEHFGTLLTGKGHRVAVLAIDPSSARSRGSILGDKTRMEALATDPKAFIRPSPSGGSLGGVARKTREAMILCEAAGYDIILVETVGVGQSEIAVHSMTDFFLLVQIAGAGDELQGIKRGIMEMADLILINKADGDNIQKANLARGQILNALHMLPSHESGVDPDALTVSAIEDNGLEEVWNHICQYEYKTKRNGFFQKNRAEQATYWMHETIDAILRQRFYSSHKEAIEKAEEEVLANRISPFAAALDLLND